MCATDTTVLHVDGMVKKIHLKDPITKTAVTCASIGAENIHDDALGENPSF